MTGQRTSSPTPLVCNVKPAQYLSIGDSFFHSGCAVIEIPFPNMKPVDIGKITFVNNYTASLSVNMKITKKSALGQMQPAWVTGVRQHTLMSKPHSETGSQSYFTIWPADFVRTPSNISALRFILRQPSPSWRTFSIEEIYVFPKTEAVTSVAQKWSEVTEDSTTNDWKPSDQAKMDGLPDPDDASRSMRRMLTLMDRVEDSVPSARLGRFDVDGSYEINLLSYT